MEPYERVMTTLSHKEPDQVPLFLFLTLHGATELGIPLRQYFSKAENVVKGQLKLSKKYGHDCLYPFFYASKEVEAFGGSTIFYPDGPPNAGKPLIKTAKDIEALVCPDPYESGPLREPLKAIKLLAKEAKGKIPIISNVIAPFSLPSMLMGLEAWFDHLLFGDKKPKEAMLKTLQSFCVSWANAQLEAGIDAVGLFDPLATSDIMTRDHFLKLDFDLVSDTINKIKGPVAYAGAGGKFTNIIDLIPQTGAAAVVLSSQDNLEKIKSTVGKKINIIGNLNNVSMSSWTPAKAASEVQKCIKSAAKDGGYIIADQHGELPIYVKESILKKIVETTRSFGRYG
jgi:uroporphyrinogen decarboxylase